MQVKLDDFARVRRAWPAPHRDGGTRLTQGIKMARITEEEASAMDEEITIKPRGIMSKDIVSFAGKIITMIEQAKQNALQSVNSELIKLYWNVGEYLSVESEKSTWGDSFIDATAEYIKENHPGIKGFNRRGLYRMRRFYDTYKGNEFVSALLTQISWTNHLFIMSGTKSIEEKEFYLWQPPETSKVIFYIR